MYVQKTVSIAALYLDPNNPRLATRTDITDHIPDSEIEGRQSSLAKRFVDGTSTRDDNDEGGFDVSDLLDSISKMGYQGIDQIVVRPIENKRHKYVVLEGNRRVASIKRLMEQHADTKVDSKRGETGRLHDDVLETLKKIEVLVLDTEGVSKEDLQHRVNLILGIRHHGSLLPWEPLPRAFNIFCEYMHELAIAERRVIPLEAANFRLNPPVRRDVARRLTIKTNEVTDFLRAYIAYCQLRGAGHDVKDRHFSLVKELVVNTRLRKHYLPNDENTFVLEPQSIDKINLVCEFGDRDKAGFCKTLDDPKSVKKLKDLVYAQFDSDNSDSVRGLARANLVSVEEKEKSLSDAMDEVISAKKREGWIQAIEDELDKLDREKQPLEYATYPGFGNERDEKNRLRKKVRKLQLLVELDN